MATISKITVDSELRAKLNGLDEQLQMCDEAGNVLGRFLPEDQYAKLARGDVPLIGGSKMQKGMVTLLGLFALHILPLPLQASGGPKYPVQMKAIAKAPDAAGNQKITIELTITAGAYIYANPIGDEIFESNATRVWFTSKNGDKIASKVASPKGQCIRAGVFQLFIYNNRVTIDAVVQTKKRHESIRANCWVSGASAPGV